jgi:hypothetical protein
LRFALQIESFSSSIKSEHPATDNDDDNVTVNDDRVLTHTQMPPQVKSKAQKALAAQAGSKAG